MSSSTIAYPALQEFAGTDGLPRGASLGMTQRLYEQNSLDFTARLLFTEYICNTSYA